MSDFYQKVGKRISHILFNINWTQQQLADEIQVSKQVMSKILNGDKNTTIMEICQIAEVLHVPVQELLDPQEVPDQDVLPVIEEGGLSEQYVPLFMGQISTDEGKAGLKRAFTIMDAILECEETYARVQATRSETVDVTGIRKVRSFIPKSKEGKQNE